MNCCIRQLWRKGQPRVRSIVHRWAPLLFTLRDPPRKDTRLSADSRLAPGQRERPLQSNTVSYWLGANLESDLCLNTQLANTLTRFFVNCLTRKGWMPGVSRVITYDIWSWVNALRLRKNVAISQATFLDAFSWRKVYELRLGFHWNLFLRWELTIFQRWFR